MFRKRIDNSCIINDSGTSEGTQIKYKVQDYWYKVDRIILNEDRHVNNLAVILGDTGFRTAPIFDRRLKWNTTY